MSKPPTRLAAWASQNKGRKARLENLNRAIPVTVNRINQANSEEETNYYRNVLQDMLTVLKEVSPKHPHLTSYKA